MDKQQMERFDELLNRVRNDFARELQEYEDDLLGDVWQIQSLMDCVKWLAEVQENLGDKQNANVFNGERACGGWYIAKINQTLSALATEKAEALMKRLGAKRDVRQIH